MKLASISYIHAVVILSALVFWQVLSTLDLSKKGEFELLKNAPEYHMGIVVPDPSIDYEFENAEIDSRFEYELRIIDPEYIIKQGRLVE